MERKILKKELPEIIETLRPLSAKHFNILVQQLEWDRLFERDLATRSIGDQKSEIDVKNRAGLFI